MIILQKQIVGTIRDTFATIMFRKAPEVALLRNLRKQARRGNLSALERKQLLQQEKRFRKEEAVSAKDWVQASGLVSVLQLHSS